MRERLERGGRQRLHPGPAIGFVPEGGRAPRRVNARRLLGLDDRHPAVGCEHRRKARPRYARAEEQPIGGGGLRGGHASRKIGTASCRERECHSLSISVGSVSLKKKKQ